MMWKIGGKKKNEGMDTTMDDRHYSKEANAGRRRETLRKKKAWAISFLCDKSFFNFQELSGHVRRWLHSVVMQMLLIVNGAIQGLRYCVQRGQRKPPPRLQADIWI